MKSRPLIALALALVAMTSSACSLFTGPDITDAAKIQELAQARAGDFGATRIAHLSLARNPKTSMGAVFVDDNGKQLGSSILTDKDSLFVTGAGQYAIDGVPVADLPYDLVVSMQSTAEQSCPGGTAATQLDGTMTGAPLITSRCLGDDSLAGQTLDGSPVSTLDNLRDPSQLQAALDDLLVVSGPSVRSVHISYFAMGEVTNRVSAENIALAGRPDSCYATSWRHLSEIRTRTDCTVSPEEPTEPLDLTAVSAEAVLEEITHMFIDMHITSLDQVHEITITSLNGLIRLYVVTEFVSGDATLPA